MIRSVQAASVFRATYEDLYNSVKYQIDEKKTPRYHSGIEQGYVSKYRPLTDDDKIKMFQRFSNGMLKPDEVPAILKTGEIVLNRPQQDAMVRNMQMAYETQFGKPATMQTSNHNSTQNITINASFPNITNETGYDSFERNMSKFFNEANLASIQYKNKR